MTDFERLKECLDDLGFTEGDGQDEFRVIRGDNEITIHVGVGYGEAPINFHFTESGLFKEHGAIR